MIKMTLALITALMVVGFNAEAKSNRDGILIVGTQTEVAQMLRGTDIQPTYSEVNPDAMVAVRLYKNTVSVYEGGAVQAIIKFVGNVVEGGVVFTLKVGSALWDLLETLACTTVNLGEAVVKAIVTVLTTTAHFVVDGVKFVAHTTLEVLKMVGEFIKDLFKPCGV